jgi:quercetin dioxygenase-like cupin family protein
MNHPSVIQLREHAKYGPDKMGKNTIYASNRVLVGLNAFEPGQEHALHAHAAMDKIYHVLEGSGQFLLEGESLPMREGEMLVAPADVAHGIRNDSSGRLLVLAVLAPAPLVVAPAPEAGP